MLRAFPGAVTANNDSKVAADLLELLELLPNSSDPNSSETREGVGPLMEDAAAEWRRQKGVQATRGTCGTVVTGMTGVMGVTGGVVHTCNVRHGNVRSGYPRSARNVNLRPTRDAM